MPRTCEVLNADTKAAFKLTTCDVVNAATCAVDKAVTLAAGSAFSCVLLSVFTVSVDRPANAPLAKAFTCVAFNTPTWAVVRAFTCVELSTAILRTPRLSLIRRSKPVVRTARFKALMPLAWFYVKVVTFAVVKAAMANGLKAST